MSKNPGSKGATRTKPASHGDFSKLPRVKVQSTTEPSLRELFLLGWQYFLPRFPESTEKSRRK